MVFERHFILWILWFFLKDNMIDVNAESAISSEEEDCDFFGGIFEVSYFMVLSQSLCLLNINL